MKTLAELTINSLKRLIRFLEKNWYNKVTVVTTAPIYSLAPKVLTEEKDLNAILPYLNNLKQAIDSVEINNIAITGSYGSGKSTILKTFQHRNPEYEYLNISLASFKDNKDNSEDPEFERKLEISILQQMFYHVEPSKIPDSRFKRIVNLTSHKLFLFTIFLVSWFFSALLLFKFDYVEKLNPRSWTFSHPVDWISVLASLLFFIGIGFFVKDTYRLFKNSKVNKLNIKGELELGDAIDKSIFNQHLEEILYFFERTAFNVVVIEDVDRFNSTDIFTKLREVNILINNSKLIKRSVKFVYAIKDEMFKDKNERVKFFEFVIPVIPFINPSNANDQLINLIASANLKDSLSHDFTSDVVTFIDDIDMRLLINIFHEYQLYRSLLSSELKQDNLFAIIVYKNLYPEDFGSLQKRKGKLFQFFANKSSYCAAVVKKYNSDLETINNRIGLLEIENQSSIKELRAVYIYRLLSKLEHFHSFNTNGVNISITEALEDKNFNVISASEGFSYTKVGKQYYSHQLLYESVTSSVIFKDIEKEVSNSLTYLQREELLNKKRENQLELLRTEKEKRKKEKNDTEQKSVQELFNTNDLDEYWGDFKEDNLVRSLLLNGYIDEHYDDYISLFHEVSLTKDDFKFERFVKSGRSLPFDHQVTKCKNVLKRVPDKYFRREEILNYKLLSYLLNNENEYRAQVESIFTLLKKDKDQTFQFIRGFVSQDSQDISLFMKKLCESKPTLWEYLYTKSELPTEDITTFLKHIFNYGDLNAILEFTSLKSLEEFLAKIPNIFEFCSNLKGAATIKSLIQKKVILIENLDLPDESQKEMFDFICSYSFYELNRHNISIIIKGQGKEVDPAKLDTSHYTTILHLGIDDLLEYVNLDIENYIEHVLLLGERNTDEDEDSITALLNKDVIPIDLKIRLLQSQLTNISSLEQIEELDVKQVILNCNKVMITWSNVFNYHEAIEQEDFDSVLIDFLNNEKNYSALSKERFPIKSKNEEYIKKISSILLFCSSLKNEAYENLLDCIPYTYNSIDFERLDKEKAEKLVFKRKLGLTAKNFYGLKEKELHIQLAEVQQDKIAAKFSELDLSAEDLLSIFRSSRIQISHKLDVIKNLQESMIVNNDNIAKAVCDLLPESHEVSFSYEALYAIFNAHSSVSKRLVLLNQNLDQLDVDQIRNLSKMLGEDYEKIFVKMHKPTFMNTPQHIVLFEELKKREMIIRYETNEKKNEIKVFAKYSENNT